MYKANPETVLLVTAVLSPSQQRFPYVRTRYANVFLFRVKQRVIFVVRKHLPTPSHLLTCQYWPWKTKQKLTTLIGLYYIRHCGCFVASTLIKKYKSICSSWNGTNWYSFRYTDRHTFAILKNKYVIYFPYLTGKCWSMELTNSR